MVWTFSIVFMLVLLGLFWSWNIYIKPRGAHDIIVQEDIQSSIHSDSSGTQPGATQSRRSWQVAKENSDTHEARIEGNVERMLSALEHESHPIERHLLYRDIIAQTFPRRHQDPQYRGLFKRMAEQHVQEMPQIIPALVDRFGTKPYFFAFSYYAIALTEDMEFDKALEVCRLALAYEAKDGLGIGFERRIEDISRRKQRAETSQAA